MRRFEDRILLEARDRARWREAMRGDEPSPSQCGDGDAVSVGGPAGPAFGWLAGRLTLEALRTQRAICVQLLRQGLGWQHWARCRRGCCRPASLKSISACQVDTVNTAGLVFDLQAVAVG